jgi:hypothetical protein
MSDVVKRAKRDWSPAADSHHVVGWAEQYAEHLLSHAEALEAQLVVAREALKDVAHPVEHLRRYAEQQGMELDGHMAQNLSSDVYFVKQIARNALAQLGEP